MKCVPLHPPSHTTTTPTHLIQQRCDRVILSVQQQQNGGNITVEVKEISLTSNGALEDRETQMHETCDESCVLVLAEDSIFCPTTNSQNLRWSEDKCT